MTAPNMFEHIPCPPDYDDIAPPDNGPYFIDTKAGYMVHKDSHWGRFLTPVKESPMLNELQPAFWNEPKHKLPHQLIGQALSFFKSIYEKQKTEAMVDITWSEERGYRLFIPPQDVSGGGVHATRDLSHYRGQIVGTIHSHCDFNAYHSGTDTHDADQHNGLHITIGDVMKQHPTIALMISDSGIRWDVSLASVVDGPLEMQPHPAWWERYVEDPAVTRAKKTEKQQQLWKENRKPTQTTTSGTMADGRKHTPTTSILTTDLRMFLGQWESQIDPFEFSYLKSLADRIEQFKDELGQYGIDMDTQYIGELRDDLFEETDEDEDAWPEFNDRRSSSPRFIPF